MSVPWQHQRQMPPPLQQHDSTWMPRLNAVNPYHCSGADIVQNGWRKWNSAGNWDWHAQSAASTAPDWYNRRVAGIRCADNKVMNWQHDKYQKPTQREMFAVEHQRVQPRDSGVDSNSVTQKPSKVGGDIKPIYYGRFEPPFYGEPCQINPMNCDSQIKPSAR